MIFTTSHRQRPNLEVHDLIAQSQAHNYADDVAEENDQETARPEHNAHPAEDILPLF